MLMFAKNRTVDFGRQVFPPWRQHPSEALRIWSTSAEATPCQAPCGSADVSSAQQPNAFGSHDTAHIDSET